MMNAKGTAWVITDAKGNLIDNIDTDMIFHNMHLHILEVSKMGAHAFGNLEGWHDFPEKCQQGDILFVGKNFGAGSSRQQAVDCFKALGVSVIIAESFGAIYKRNAINSGMAIMEAPNLPELNDLKSGVSVEVDYQTGELIVDSKTTYRIKPMSGIQKEIYIAGDLFTYGRDIVKD
jgi:3-isopropylmalate/(R)-2-methylmalate dehydratase small subunit